MIRAQTVERIAPNSPVQSPLLDRLAFADAKPLWGGDKLVKGWLDRQQISVLYGPPGCGKTFLALDLSLHVAMGSDWNGCRVRQGPVVYVACEAGRSIANRLCAFRLYCGLDGVEVPFTAITESVDLCHVNRKTGKKPGLMRLGETITAIGKPSLIVIDTVSRALNGGNENSPDDMGSFVGSIDKLRDTFGGHVMVVHHVGKDRDRGARGHSLLLCNVDTAVEVERHDNGASTATVEKQRDGPIGKSLTFQLRVVELGRDSDGDPVTSCVVERGERPARPEKGQPARALRVLEELIMERGQPDLTGRSRVEVEAWREACGRSFGWKQKSDAERMGWKRVWDEHKAGDGRVGVSADGLYVWFKTAEEMESENRSM